MKKVIKIGVIVLTSIVFALSAWLYYLSVRHHNIAHEKLVTYLNKEFEGQVHFRDFSLSYLRSFPKIHVEIMDFAILDSGKEIVKIGDLDLMLNLRSLWKKQIKIDKAIINDLVFISEIDSLGRKPEILKSKSHSSDSTSKSLLIDAKKIILKNSLVKFINDVKGNVTSIRIYRADLKLQASDSMLTISGNLNGHLDSLVSNKKVLFADLPVKGKDILFEINHNTGVKELKSGYLESNTIILKPNLRMEPYEDGQLIQFQLSGGERFDVLLTLFRLHLGFDLSQVNPDAELHLSYNQKGFVNAFLRPYSELDFIISNAVFEGKDLPFPIELIHAKGNYNNGTKHSPQTVVLEMDSIFAKVRDSQIAGHFKLTDMHDPVIDAHLVSILDMAHLVKETEDFRLSGVIDLKLSVNGRISELKKFHVEGKQQAYGEINFHNMELLLKKDGYSIRVHNGTTKLNNHLLEFTAIVGALNESAFHFQGQVENLDQYLLKENEQLIGKLYLDFDEIDIAKFSSGPDKKVSTGNQSMMTISNVMFEFLINGKKVVTPWGDLKNFSTNVLLANESVTVEHLRFDHQEGHIESSGKIMFNEKGITININSLIVDAFNGNTSARGKVTIDSAGVGGIWLDASMNFDQLQPEEVINSLGLSSKGKKNNQAFTFPEDVSIKLDFYARSILYRDLKAGNTRFNLQSDNKAINIQNLMCDLPFGKFHAGIALQDYRSPNYSVKGDIAMDISSLNLDELLAKDYLKSITGSNNNNAQASKKAMDQKPGLPDNLDLTFKMTAGHLSYEDIIATNLSLEMAYDDTKIELKELDMDFAKGHIHLEGHLQKDQIKNYPAYVYLNVRNVLLEDILFSFNNFDQEKFTFINSSGEISAASHHYFSLGKDFSIIQNDNLWIGNVMIHKARFNQVEPIEKTLFFVGHKVKDSMIVSNLNINILLNKDKLYFRDILMNDNIANLELSGYLDIDDREMDLATEISLTDLFFRSKKERIAETQEGIMTLDEDAKIFVRLYGPMSDHKIDIMKKHKFARYQADLHDKISAAEKAYQK